MLRLNSERFLHLMGNLRDMRGIMLPVSGSEASVFKRGQVTIAVDPHMREDAAELSNLLKQMDLRLSYAAAKRFEGFFSSESIDPVAGDQRISELTHLISDELAAMFVLVLRSDQAELYEPDAPLWGPDVRSKFPGSTKDIDEAGKCLALSRPTAAVFHCMRVMEVALKAVRDCLGVTPSGRNWGDALNDIRDERIRRGKKWAKNDFFQEVYGRLDAIKDAWRNSTMHVDNVYTEEDAARIFDYTKGFMQKIASQMDEDGLPRA